MTRLTDGIRTVEIEMFEEGYPEWSREFFETGSLEHDDAQDAYKVGDVSYCIEQALDWRNGTGDFTSDFDGYPEGERPHRTVYVEGVDGVDIWTVRDLALNLMENADETPGLIDRDRAAELIGWLDPEQAVVVGLTPYSLMAEWNDIIRESANNDE